MKKLFVFVCLALLFLQESSSFGQDVRAIKGSVFDENKEALPFVTVALRSLPDSTVISGTVTDEQGRFMLDKGGDILEISMIGYGTQYFQVGSIDAELEINMKPDSKLLQEAMVSATLPKTELKGDAVVTNISGSVLEHSGNAYDVLAKVPGMISRNGQPEVIGRGTPVYYLNGRKVTDDSELKNLMSEDIKSVDVISNPGSLYGGEVRCVVRIRTVKRQGDGLSFALTSQAKQYIYKNHDFEPSWSVLDLNYRKGGWDFFGKIVYWNQWGYQFSDIYSGTYTKPNNDILENVQEGILQFTKRYIGLQYNGGANWQINENHSLGFKLDYSSNNRDTGYMLIDNDVYSDGRKIDHLTAVNDSYVPSNGKFMGNLYYDGTIGKLNINFNADVVTSKTSTDTDVTEESWIAPAQIHSSTSADQRLGAGKLILSYPIWKGLLQAGTEETYVFAKQEYNITKIEIPSADASLTENTLAGFAQYALTLPFGQISAGLRYEHVNFDYIDKVDAEHNLNRVQNNWFPSVSFAAQAGDFGFNLSYTGKTVRPNYGYLSNEITYDNRFTYQTGNPKLLNEIQRTLSLSVNWKWLTFSGNYENVENSFFQWAYPYNDQGVVMIQYDNAKDPVNRFNFYLNASPTIGVWNPRYTAGITKQYFSTTVNDPRVEGGKRVVELNRPMYMIQADNAFRFKHSWILEANYRYMSPFDDLIAHIQKPLQILEMTVSKSFFKDESLNLKLRWSDILDSNVYYTSVDFGNCEIRQSNDGFSPCVMLLISYRFNSARSKYKGTGAGQDAAGRMN